MLVVGYFHSGVLIDIFPFHYRHLVVSLEERGVEVDGSVFVRSCEHGSALSEHQVVPVEVPRSRESRELHVRHVESVRDVHRMLVSGYYEDVLAEMHVRHRELLRRSFDESVVQDHDERLVFDRLYPFLGVRDLGRSVTKSALQEFVDGDTGGESRIPFLFR